MGAPSRSAQYVRENEETGMAGVEESESKSRAGQATGCLLQVMLGPVDHFNIARIFNSNLSKI